MTGAFMRIEIGKALHGDCLFIEWGDGGQAFRMLIDGGPIGAFSALDARIKALRTEDPHFELMVLSHVDTDHIEGIVRIFAEPAEQWPFTVKDVWFNGWRHLDPSPQLLGGNQGEFFSALLARRLGPDAWNGAFKGESVVVPSAGSLPVVELRGGMKLTLLSPTPEKLEKMRDAWRKDLKTSGLKPGALEQAWKALAQQKKYLPADGLLSGEPSVDALLSRQFRPDNAAANGSSIAFLAEHVGGSGLFLADAHTDVVCASLRRLLDERGLKRLRVDAVKVSHHGSKGNTDDALISLIESPRFLISTNGAQFKHPDEETIARIISGSAGEKPTLFFNYLSDFNRMWQSPERQQELGYRAVFNEAEDEQLVVSLS